MKIQARPFLCKIWGAVALCALFLLLSLCLYTPVYAMEQADDPAPTEADASMETDINPWHKVTLSPGQTYDVGSASANTTVYIDEPGDYYLKGKSTKCRVLVRSGDVNLYLKDGLNIDPGATSYVGSSTAAITIEDQGGTVRIISEKNATIYLGGYYYAPAIRKDGHNTKLIFETEDPANPGTITAYRSAASHSAGIGSVYFLIADSSYTGNMEFKSGNIIATGGTNAAGIGCGSGANQCVDLLFSGANVTATGYGYGAGIGGGLGCSVDKIKITGGTIVAKGSQGAGIGGGRCDSSYQGHSGTITITGGNITATSEMACGIGTGEKSNIDRIVITGGTITATSTESYSSGAGIGGGGANFYGYCKQIDISGGTIYAKGGDAGGVGIGSSLHGGSGNNTVNISGGYIETVAGNKGVSLGGGGKGAVQDTGHCYVNISGGTVLCGTGDKARIGSDYSMTCTITGGSVRTYTLDGKATDQPNGEGNTLTMMNINLKNCPLKTKVTDATFIGAGVDYGMKDVYTADGDTDYTVVYPWLPYESSTTEMTAGGILYYGNVLSSQGEGFLYPATKIVLDRNTTEASAMNGEAAGVKGETAARDIVHAKRPGYTVKGYTSDAEGKTLVMNTDGSYVSTRSGFTDTGSKWIPEGGTVTLYALWEGNRFTVHFDGNQPAGASMTVSGSMADQSFTYGNGQALTANGFTLTGYTFTGWNTEANGTGTAVTDLGDGSKLCSEPGGTVTLYAQWTPVTYTVLFDGNGATSGTMARQTLTFDKSQSLSTCAFTKDGEVFGGWERVPNTGFIYRDGQTVENLADTQGVSVTLRAIWLSRAQLMFYITVDGKVPTIGTFTLVNGGGTAFDVPMTKDASGLYIFDGAQLPADTYTVYLDGENTGKTVSTSSGQVEVFAYYTVTATAGNHVGNVSVMEGNGQGAVYLNGETVYPAGSQFLLTATDFDTGYVFDRWQSPGVDPTYASGKTAKSNPTVIAITAKTSMVATARGAIYGVKFNGNAPENASTAVTGHMETQDFTYGEAQTLYPCDYTLTGYTFTGWNSRPDGTGTTYADRASVMDLSATEGETVNLYAQWQPITYKVLFDAGSGSGSMPAVILTFDQPENLPENRFTKTDCHFTGWAYEDTLFGDGAQVVNLSSTQDDTVTLYAQWKKDIPKTGDESKPLLWAGLTVAAGAGLVTMTVTRRKRKR